LDGGVINQDIVVAITLSLGKAIVEGYDSCFSDCPSMEDNHHFTVMRSQCVHA